MPWSAKRPRCVCPDSVDARRAAHRKDGRRKYIQGYQQGSKGRRLGYDWVAVERAIEGDRHIVLTIQERAAAVARLTKQGASAAEIARRLRITARTVVRYRAGCHATPTHQE